MDVIKQLTTKYPPASPWHSSLSLTFSFYHGPNCVEDYLRQNARFWFLHPNQATIWAKRPTQREAWHTAPFHPSLERLEQKWARWGCCVGLRKKGMSGFSGKKFKFIFFLLFLLPVPRTRAKRAEDSHLETHICPCTPPCPPWLKLWDPESNLTVPTSFLLLPSFVAAFRPLSTCLPYPLQHQNTRF